MSRPMCARCDFTADNRAELVEHATEAQHPLCGLCGRSLALDEIQTCLRCAARTRSALADIPDLYALLPAELEGRAGAATPPDASGVRADSAPAMPGGDVLALLAPGAGRWLSDRGDTPSAVGVLALWEDDWRAARAEPAAGLPTMSTTAGYLLARHAWAAQHHPAYPEFARDVRQLAAQLRRAIRQDEPVDRGAGIGCPECGETLERRYLDGTGRTDDWHCPNRACARVVTRREYHFAVWAHLEDRAC